VELCDLRSHLRRNLLGLETSDGMRDDDEFQRREALRLGKRQRKGEEGVGDKGDRRDTALLKLDSVVDTPRRARASIAERYHGGLALLREVVVHVIQRRNRGALLQITLDPVLRMADRCEELIEKCVPIGLPVPEEPEPQIGQGRGTSREGSGRAVGRTCREHELSR